MRYSGSVKGQELKALGVSESGTITEGLKALLQHYGTLAVTLHHLMSERPATHYESLDAYYESLGNPLPDEPVLMVRISKDGETRFLKKGEHDVMFEDDSGQETGNVTVWELPENEFWFYRAFRPGIFDLNRDLPNFLYAMGIVDAFGIFEGYLSDLLKERLRQHPRLMGSKRQLSYEQIFEAASKDDIVETMIDREIGELTYLSLSDLLTKMRKRIGFRDLTCDYDKAVCELAIVRNCLLHNHGKADRKLSEYSSAYQSGDTIRCDMKMVDSAINTLRRLAYEIDRTFLRNL